jgi:predicted CoA-binding protein
MKPTDLEAARRFFAAKRIAVVGVSRDEKDFSRFVLRELARRGHDVVPVNPGAREIEGRRAFARVTDVVPRVDAALLLTAPAQTERVLADCAAAGIRSVWLHRGAGVGAATPAALALCTAHGIEAVHGLCPFMALPGAAFPHRVHGFFRTRFGRDAPRA